MSPVEIEVEQASLPSDELNEPSHSPSMLSSHESVSMPTSGQTLDEQVHESVALARKSQSVWSSVAIRNRLQILKALRQKIARDPRSLAARVGRSNIAETLAAEVLPLLDACRFLENEAAEILAPRSVGNRSRPMWLWGNRVDLIPEPLGVVLIIGPANYPLMLPGIQALQAIAAGNSVLLKPAINCSESIKALIALAESVGLPAGVIQVIPESPDAVAIATSLGIDKVFLTGSANTGQLVSGQLAGTTTPAVMELSGCDAVFVLDDADVDLVANCLTLGLTFNQSQTCMAPRRVFASDVMTDQIVPLLQQKLDQRLHAMSTDEVNPGFGPNVARISAKRIQEAISAGATLVRGSLSNQGGLLEMCGVVLLDHVTADMSIAQSDLSVPVLSFLRMKDVNQSVIEHARCPLKLSASIFGSTAPCRDLARRIHAGCITVNDIIVPTADPRVPFGGRGQSGHGITRGKAGLLEMTNLKAVISTRRWFKPHLQAPTPHDADLLAQLIQIEHSSNPMHSLKLVPNLIKSMLSQIQYRKSTAGKRS